MIDYAKNIQRKHCKYCPYCGSTRLENTRIKYIIKDNKFCLDCKTHFEVEEDWFNDFGEEE